MTPKFPIGAWSSIGCLIFLTACDRIATTPQTPVPVASKRGAAGLEASSPPRFTDIAREAGLTIPRENAVDGRFRLIETMGSGVGLIDFDGDGWLDVFVAQGAPIPREPRDASGGARLYRNLRDGRFADVTASAGVGFLGFGQGVAVGDYNGDGRDDLFVAGFGRSVLYQNQGDAKFVDVTDRAGVAGAGWPTSCAFADLDGDGDLDLYVVRYLSDTIDAQGRPTATCNAAPGQLGYCPPNVFAAEPDLLYRNNGDGTFTEVSRDSGIAATPGNGLGLAIADFDGDGRLDVFVANDQSPNLLFHNLGGLKFEEVGTPWGLAFNEAGASRAGMGVAAGDYDGDGLIDLCVTNFYEESNTLYRNLGGGRFAVTTAQARLTVPTRSKLGFGVVLFDFDHDGRLDLFEANGHINDVSSLGMPYSMTANLFRNIGGGRFADVSDSAGDYFRSPTLGRATAVGDLDNDGDLDLVVTHLDRPPALLRNDTKNLGHWINLRLSASSRSRSAVGAKVIVRAGGEVGTRFVVAGTSYLASSDPRVHVGLGPAVTAESVAVIWPDGSRQSWEGLQADRFYEVSQGSSPRPIDPRATP